ncbi:MAG TPA: DUF3302 domain-containing protein [Waddliaceae bacterium]
MSFLREAPIGTTIEVLIVMACGLLLTLTILFVLGPLPGRIARKRNHPQAKAIRACGWTAILSSSPAAWVLALSWAYRDPIEPSGDLEQRIIALEKKAKRRQKLFS